MTTQMNSLIIIALIILALTYALYLAILPRPINGIPHNANSARQILGDVPSALRYREEHHEMSGFITDQLVKLNKPVIQLFLRPFGKPWVVVADFREAQDVMLRRSREFDRSDFFSNLFTATMPACQVQMRTGEEWKHHRRLTADTMSHQFLHHTAGPLLFDNLSDLVQLWRIKSRLAQGRPISVKEDVRRTSLDTIFAVTFASNLGATSAQSQMLSTLTAIEVPDGRNLEAIIPAAPTPEAYDSIVKVADSSGIPLRSPFPLLHHWLAVRLRSDLRNAIAQKDKIIRTQLLKAWDKFNATPAGELSGECAVDLMLQREVQMARKEGRPVDWCSQTLRDEIFGFLVAGHDTAGAVMQWTLRWLTAEQRVQRKIRSELRYVLEDHHDGGSLSAEVLCKADLPYIDAVIAEINRHDSASQIQVRVATTDTSILGHHIPEGTDVFFPICGPSFLTPPMQIDERLRSASSRESKAKYGVWENSNIGSFLPERWLAKDEKGCERFDPRAGPSLPFGAGIRGCFGRKLGEMQLRMFIALVVWNFDLQPTPAALSSFSKHEELTTCPRQCYVRLAEFQ